MRRARQEWQGIFEEFEGSGEAHEAFCAQRGLNVGTFRAWLYKLRGTRGRRSRAASVRMIPVRIRAPKQVAAPGADAVVEIAVLGAVLRVRVGTDVRYVAELASALAPRC